MSHPISYITAQRALRDGLNDLRIIAGQRRMPAHTSFADLLGTAATNLSCVARYLEQVREDALYGEANHKLKVFRPVLDPDIGNES